MVSQEYRCSLLNVVKEQLRNAEAATFQVNLAAKAALGRTVDARSLNLETSLAAKLQSEIVNTLESSINIALEDLDGIADFNYDTFKAGRLAHLDANSLQPLHNWIHKIPSLGGIRQFDGDANFLANLRFMYTEMTFGEDTLRTFRLYTPSKVIRKGILASFFENTYVEVKGTNVLSLDDRVDFFQWKDDVFISYYGGFELILDMKPITESIARESFQSLTALLPVSDAKGLQGALFANKRFMRAVAGLGTKNNVSKMNMDRIARLISSSKLPLSVGDLGGAQTLFVDPNDKEQVRAYLRLLRDDYVQSLLTDIKYIGIEKSEWAT